MYPDQPDAHRLTPGRTRRRSLVARVLLMGLLCLSALLAAPERLRAQATWEYSPYRIRVWVAMDDSPELTERLVEQIAATLADRGGVAAGAAWDVRTALCPPELRHDALTRIADITVDDMARVAGRRLQVDDKLVLLAVQAEATGFRLSARELDCRTRTWQPVVHRTVVQSRRIPAEAFAAVHEAFAPLVRVDSVRGRAAEARVRAGGLILDEDNAAHIREHDILRPVIRRNDRLGEPLDNGIMVVPWTFLTVQQRDGSMLHCQAHSGMYALLGVRPSARLHKYALLTKPVEDHTRLRLIARGRASALPGYEIYCKDPDTEENTVLGRTDWRGTLTVRRGDMPLQILYVRNGGRLLARLPIVPGLEPELTAELRDDNRRLEAEGYVRGLQNLVMDLVARRELYISRFRRHLRAGEYDQARALLEEFATLPTRSDLARDLVQQGQRFASGDLSDRREQAQIDQLFKDTHHLLTRFLDPGTASELAAELEQARRAG